MILSFINFFLFPILSLCYLINQNDDRQQCTEVFAVEVIEELDDWDEKYCRTREWMSFEEAKKKLSLYKPYQCEYITKFRQSSEYLIPKDSQEQQNNELNSSGQNE